jgi:hypothetical protein
VDEGESVADVEPPTNGVDDPIGVAELDDDYEWPQLSPLELAVCLADGATRRPARPDEAGSSPELVA